MRDGEVSKMIVSRTGSVVPVDGVTVLIRHKTVNKTVLMTSFCLCASGVVMALFFLSFNLYYRKHRYLYDMITTTTENTGTFMI